MVASLCELFMEKRLIAPPDANDLALVKKWFRRLSEQVQAVDFAGARPLFAGVIISRSPRISVTGTVIARAATSALP